jgi:lipoyl(octanoyl) transferase
MRFIELGKTTYPVALIDMEIAFEAVQNGADECVFITEHEVLYSVGKSFVDGDFLGRVDAPIYYPNRGGRITVHSPGQIVVYPIINIRTRDINVRQYIGLLEGWMMSALHEFAAHSFKSEEGRGIWTASGKIGFIGIRVAKGVACHGLCLNVSNDLSFFEMIIPCGIKRLEITSMEQILRQRIGMSMVASAFVKTSPF